jgi:TonB family protein
MNNLFFCLELVLLALPWSSPIICGKLQYATQVDDSIKVIALLNNYPKPVFNIDAVGRISLDPTPLHMAVVQGRKDVAEFLLVNIAEDTAGNAWIGKGRIPLHEEVLKNHKDMVTSILIKGGDPNAKDNQGITPLHLAAAKGYIDMARLLLNQKADINVETNFGSTPLDIAMAIGNKEILELFRLHGGRVGSGVLILDIDSVQPPKPFFQPLPPTTEKARKAGIIGRLTLVLQGISRKDGTIDNLKVMKGAGYGIDEEAIKTIRKWRWTPGTLNNNPIDVGITIQIRYSID